MMISGPTPAASPMVIAIRGPGIPYSSFSPRSTCTQWARVDAVAERPGFRDYGNLARARRRPPVGHPARFPVTGEGSLIFDAVRTARAVSPPVTIRAPTLSMCGKIKDARAAQRSRVFSRFVTRSITAITSLPESSASPSARACFAKPSCAHDTTVVIPVTCALR